MSASPVFLSVVKGVMLAPEDRELVAKYNAAITAKSGVEQDKGKSALIRQGAFGFTVGGKDRQFFRMEDLIAPLAERHNIEMSTIKSLSLSPERITRAGIIIPAGARLEEPHA